MPDSLISLTDHESKVPYLFRLSITWSCADMAVQSRSPAAMVNES